MRAMLTLVVIFPLVLQLGSVAGAELLPGGTFTDDNGNPHEASIEAIAAAGITSGCGPSLYCPDQVVTRAEMAAFLLRGIGQAANLPAYQGHFSDVPPGQWYTGYVEHLSDLGITTGRGDGTYGPNDSVSRAEMATFILRAIGMATNLPAYHGTFSDVAQDVWYRPYVEELYALGITTGCATDPLRYCPVDPVKRDQMATFLTRALGLTPIIPPPPPTTTTTAAPTGAVNTFLVGVQPVVTAYDGTYIWGVNSGAWNGRVWKVRASDGVVIDEFLIGPLPSGIAFDGTYIWVTDFFDHNVYKVQTSNGAVVATIPVGRDPGAATFDGTNIWVANQGDKTVTKILASTGAVLATISVGSLPSRPLFDGTYIWVANGSDDTLTKIRASTGAVVATFPVGDDPYAIAFDGTYLWVPNLHSASVSKILASTGAVVATIPVGLQPEDVAFDGTYVWVVNGSDDTVTKILASTGAVVGTIPVGDYPASVLFDGTYVWVGNYYDGTVSRFAK